MSTPTRSSLATLALLALCSSAASADGLIVAANDEATGRSVFAWSPQAGWTGPIVGGRSLPVSPGSVGPGGLTAGGYGCALYASDGPTTVACASGACGATPVMTRATWQPSVDVLVADDRHLYSFWSNFSGPEIVLGMYRIDTVTGDRLLLPDFNFSTPFFPEIADAVLHGNAIDVVAGYLTAEGTQVVRVNTDGKRLGNFSVPGARFLGVTYHAPSDTLLAVDASGQLRRFSTDWQQQSSTDLGADAARLAESLAVVGDELVLLERQGVDTVLRRYSLSGDLLGTIEAPPGVSRIDSVAERRCEPDDTRVLLGPDGRLEVSGTVTDFQGNRLPMRFPPKSSRDSVQSFVFEPSNREGLFKALDACALNGRIWFFGAIATTTSFELQVRDRTTGASMVYRNQAGQRASAIEDTQSFPCN